MNNETTLTLVKVRRDGKKIYVNHNKGVTEREKEVVRSCEAGRSSCATFLCRASSKFGESVSEGGSRSKGVEVLL